MRAPVAPPPTLSRLMSPTTGAGTEAGAGPVMAWIMPRMATGLSEPFGVSVSKVSVRVDSGAPLARAVACKTCPATSDWAGMTVPLVSFNGSAVLTTKVCPTVALFEFNPLFRAPRSTIKGTATAAGWAELEAAAGGAAWAKPARLNPRITDRIEINFMVIERIRSYRNLDQI